MGRFFPTILDTIATAMGVCRGNVVAERATRGLHALAVARSLLVRLAGQVSDALRPRALRLAPLGMANRAGAKSRRYWHAMRPCSKRQGKPGPAAESRES